MSGSEKLSKSSREKFLETLKKLGEEASTKTPEELKFSYKGILYPHFICSEATFQALEMLEAREDDVLIVTYPKCGTNWSVQILREMLFSIHSKEPTIDHGVLEFGKPEKYEHLKQLPSPRLLTSHLTYNNIPKSICEKTKILLILRNPKDAAVSYYHFTNSNPVLPTYSSWDLFFKDFISGNIIYGSYFDHVLGWEKLTDDANILALTFEDMKMDFSAEIRKISDFYGLFLTDEQIQDVQNKTTFKSMKDKSSETHGDLANAIFRKGRCLAPRDKKNQSRMNSWEICICRKWLKRQKRRPQKN
ncbi:sulfotransferase 6B1-like isoform X3 [Mixophyes fleayi]|uniref:sulfotransferase 6B1-like isoform X3 n=1 Tax=Mixophyes fleayi TaxID=3061075 RepID=UPI003F4D84D6